MAPGDSAQQSTTIAAQAQGIVGQIASLGSMINTIGFGNVLTAAGLIWLFSFFMGWVPNPLVSTKQFAIHHESQVEQVTATKEMIKQLREIKCDNKPTLQKSKDCYKDEALNWR